MSEAAHDPTPAPPVSLAALFLALLAVSLCGAGGGGGLVWSRRIVVEQRRWISERDFADIVSLCQFMPGPNVVGISVCVGAKLRGGTGAIASLSGFLVIPWIIGMTLGVLYLRFAHLPVLQNILSGLTAAASGMLIATGIKMLMPHRRRPAALVFAALALGLMAFTTLPLLVVLFGLVPLGIAVACVERARP